MPAYNAPDHTTPPDLSPQLADSVENRSVPKIAIEVLAQGLALTGLVMMLAGCLRLGSPFVHYGSWCLLSGIAVALFVKRLCDYRFTLWILLANLAALMVPEAFKSIGDVRLTDPWILLIVIQLIMFGMGTQMSVRDFYQVLNMPGAVAIGVSSQFLIMPLLGFTLAISLPLPPEVAAGLVLIGSCSSGLASNVMTYMARGNLALSVTLTAITTALAPIATPLWMKLLAGSFIDVDAMKMSLDIIKMVLVPILAAFMHDFLTTGNRVTRMAVWILFAASLLWLSWLTLGGWHALTGHLLLLADAKTVAWLGLPGFVAAACVFGVLYHFASMRWSKIQIWMPRISMIGIIYFTLAITAEGRHQLVSVGPLLIVAVTVHNVCGFLLGYWASRLLGLSQADARTIAIEVGLQNGAMATGIARGMDKLGTTGLAAMIFAPLMNITGSVLANFWRRRPPLDLASKAEQISLPS